MVIRDRIAQAYAPSEGLKGAYASLQAAAIAYSGPDTFLEHPDSSLKSSLTKVKKEIKDAYFSQQGFMCCYCCLRLAEHKGSYDLEHVVSKKKFAAFMFVARNLAAVCKTCNTAKSDSDVLSALGIIAALSALPRASNGYLVVHPHFDEWGEHLQCDEYGRILVKGGSSKRSVTYEMCKFKRQNILAIAGSFMSPDKQAAQKFLNKFFGAKTDAVRQKYLNFLNDLVAGYEHGPARTLLRELAT